MLTGLFPQIAVELFSKIQKAYEGKFVFNMSNTCVGTICHLEFKPKRKGECMMWSILLFEVNEPLVKHKLLAKVFINSKQ